MRIHPLVFVAALLLAAAAGVGAGWFLPRPPLPTILPGLGGGGDPPANLKEVARREALTEYLDGKALHGQDRKPVLGVNGNPLVFKKADIEAVQFADSSSKSGDNPWGTDVTVLASVDGKRYSVQGRLEYRDVANTIAIVSFTPTEVSPQ